MEWIGGSALALQTKFADSAEVMHGLPFSGAIASFDDAACLGFRPCAGPCHDQRLVEAETRARTCPAAKTGAAPCPT